MGKGLVTLVNPNLVHPPITPYALDILTTSLEDNGFDVDVVDLSFRRDDWRTALQEYFTGRDPVLIGITIRNTDTIYPQEQRVFINSHRDIINQIKDLITAPIVAGGVGFSSMPFALVDYFDIPFGVKGPGERPIVSLADTILSGGNPHAIPELIINSGGGRVHRVPPQPRRPRTRDAVAANIRPAQPSTAYRRHSGVARRVDNLAYYQRGGLGNILTKNGCPFACTHCVEPDAKGMQFTRREVHAVVDEMEQLNRQGVYDLHTTDSEFNLLITHSKAVLEEVIRRKHADDTSPLHRLRLWIYSQPAPFDEELMALLADAGCAGINVAPDHVREDLLNGWKITAGGSRFYNGDDVDLLCSLARTYEIPVMTEVLLGMPGETEQTLRECVERSLRWDVAVVGYTLGIRVFPYSPLGKQLAEDCAGRFTVPGLQSNTALEPIVLIPLESCATALQYERQFLFDDQGRIRPVYYFSPDLPEERHTIESPNGRWVNSLNLLRELVPASEHHRVMLPTLPGLTEDDNNYADNPFLLQLVKLGYKGAFWSHWPNRQQIMRVRTASPA
ncbi:tryptophan 2-C-methyltransferase [Saccharomonospora sp. NPDC046836]|uniref:tryptophan 2-C-methyltransferase n=1 Tax=Saccharomonospora sp. NPDC046836 TaxID=3156921 RepID=UPI0033C2EEBF